MSTAVVLFTRDLRLSDNPTLHAALDDHEQVAPVFVLDDAILGDGYNRPNRARFLADCLKDLDGSLRARGGHLVLRRGDVAAEAVKAAREAAAGALYVAADVSRYAASRERRLREGADSAGIELHVVRGTHYVVPPGDITAAGRDHMEVFTPYHRRWAQRPMRPVYQAPRRIQTPSLASLPLPRGADICGGTVSPDLPHGGETEARQRLRAWLRGGVVGYSDHHDDVAGDATSRLSPYLHFGCLSATETVTLAARRGGPGAEAFVRQIAWRDFHAQVLAARPQSTRVDYRTRGDEWRSDDDELDAWKTGRTGYPIVDAGMRQLAREGWMHNRARLITASFLTKTLYLDWRKGAAHFLDLLVDGDIANNTMNWQWVAGTGTDTRPHRVYNMTLQAQRHDPDGAYVRRYVPELASVPGPAVHEPWALPPEVRDCLDYPAPIVDAKAALSRFRAARQR